MMKEETVVDLLQRAISSLDAGFETGEWADLVPEEFTWAAGREHDEAMTIIGEIEAYLAKMEDEAETIVERCARAAHEVNRAYCMALSDFSQKPWDDASEWQRDSARVGARLVLDDPNHTPEKAHESWLAQKMAEGWVYGEVKDPVAKTHPCCVPYDELPLAQRAKDHIFIAVVLQMMDDG
jgi:hypothetical protein